MQKGKNEKMKTTTEVLRNAIMFYGSKAQKLKAIEEMSELTKELCKDGFNKANKLNIAEEMADVFIMLEQLQMIYANEKEVNYYKEIKINRLNERLLKESMEQPAMSNGDE